MKKVKIQGYTYLVLTNGSIIKVLTCNTKRIAVLGKDLYTEHNWNPHKKIKNVDWKDTWSKFNWINFDSNS